MLVQQLLPPDFTMDGDNGGGLDVDYGPVNLTIGPLPAPSAVTILLLSLLALLDVLVIIANTLVIYAFSRDHKLRVARNYYLCSLAIADLMIALITVPVYAHALVLGFWAIGKPMCFIWNLVDNICLTASHMSMVLISYDRHCLVADPFNYHTSKIPKRAATRVALMWLMVCLTKTVWIGIGQWMLQQHTDLVPCSPTELIDMPYIIGIREFDIPSASASCIAEVLLPLGVMVYCNSRVYLVIRARSRNSLQMQCKASANSPANRDSRQQLQFSLDGSGRDTSTPATDANKTQSTSVQSPRRSVLRTHRLASIHPAPTKRSVTFRHPIVTNESQGSRENWHKVSGTASISPGYKSSQDKKSGITLLLFITCFTFFKLPLTAAMMTAAICRKRIDPDVYEGLTWLFRAKVLVNPFLYSFISRGFRQYYTLHFFNIFHCKNKKR
jgi:hypothetical protein